MPDLTPDDVQAQLVALGLTTQDNVDLQEVTHRINAIREALSALEPEGIDNVEPMTIINAWPVHS